MGRRGTAGSEVGAAGSGTSAAEAQLTRPTARIGATGEGEGVAGRIGEGRGVLNEGAEGTGGRPLKRASRLEVEAALSSTEAGEAKRDV